MSASETDPPAPGDDDVRETTVLARQAPARPLARATPPLITAPMSVDRAPKASAGPATLLVVLNEALRKTGLRKGLRLLREVNQSEGVNCPGCAWPGPERPRRYEVCESGARATLYAAEQRDAGPRLFATYTIPELATRSDHWLSSNGRLSTPMVRRADALGYEPIAWDEALDMIADALRALPSPDQAVFYSSARINNEASFALQLLARELGTNNLPSSSQLCHDASRLAMHSVLGSWRNPVSPSDFAAADAIFVFGQNPGSNHPRMLAALRDARQRGATIVSINPLHEVGFKHLRDPRRAKDWFGAGGEIATHHVPVRVGGDLALLEALCKATIESDTVLREFVDRDTQGYDALETALASRSWPELVARCGVEEAQIRELATIYATSKATLACWGTGLTQHRDGVAAVEQLLTWLLLRGNIGKPGAGPFAALGHSNTAGCWSMGIDVDPERLDRARYLAGTGLELPAGRGLDLCAATEAMAKGEVSVLIGVGGNLLSASPATEAVAAGLRTLDLSVHLATRLNRSHLVTGRVGLLLPCLAGHEYAARRDSGEASWSSHEDACGRVSASRGRSPGRDQARSELDILTAVAARLWPDSPREWTKLGQDPRAVHTMIAATMPGCEGFADGQLAPGRPLDLPRPAREGRFLTASGKAQLRHVAASPTPAPSNTPAPIDTPAPNDAPAPKHALWLTSIRSHDQHNSLIYAAGDRERGIGGYRRILLANLEDILRLEFEPYQQVDLTSHFGGVERCAPRWVLVPHHVRPGCVAAYWPEINVLMPPDDLDPRSHTPSLKSVAVTLAAVADRA